MGGNGSGGGYRGGRKPGAKSKEHRVPRFGNRERDRAKKRAEKATGTLQINFPNGDLMREAIAGSCPAADTMKTPVARRMFIAQETDRMLNGGKAPSMGKRKAHVLKDIQQLDGGSIFSDVQELVYKRLKKEVFNAKNISRYFFTKIFV